MVRLFVELNHRIFNEIMASEKVEDTLSFISQLIFYDYDIVKTKMKLSSYVKRVVLGK